MERKIVAFRAVGRAPRVGPNPKRMQGYLRRNIPKRASALVRVHDRPCLSILSIAAAHVPRLRRSTASWWVGDTLICSGARRDRTGAADRNSTRGLLRQFQSSANGHYHSPNPHRENVRRDIIRNRSGGSVTCIEFLAAAGRAFRAFFRRRDSLFLPTVLPMAIRRITTRQSLRGCTIEKRAAITTAAICRE